jgi:hypothetical protein
VGVQQADRHGIEAVQALSETAHGGLVDRRDHRAVVAEPLGHLEDVPPRHQRPGRPVAHVVHDRPVGPADLVDVAEPLGGEQRDARPAPLQEGVEAGGGAVGERLDLVEADAEAFDRGDHAVGEPAGRGQRLGAADAAALVDAHRVGEGPADVHADPQAHATPPGVAYGRTNDR